MASLDLKGCLVIMTALLVVYKTSAIVSRGALHKANSLRVGICIIRFVLNNITGVINE